MPNIEDFKPESRFCCLLVSASGDGKSTAAASFPKPYHELDPDLRFNGIFGSVKQGVIGGKGISYEQFDPLGGWEPIGKAIEQLNMRRIAAKTGQIFPYKSIGLGSLGSIERIILAMARQQLGGHKVIGGITLTAPGDYRVSNSGVHTLLDYLTALPCNVICTAHLIPKWGKPKAQKEGDEYKPAEIIGETLNFHDNLAESVCSRFNDIYRFERHDINGIMKYTVEFAGKLAKNSFGIKPGSHDITGKSFYEYLLNQIEVNRK